MWSFLPSILKRQGLMDMDFAAKKYPCFFQDVVLLYFLTGMAEAILAFVFTLGKVDVMVLIKALSVNYFISIGLLVFYGRFQNFGASLISILGLLIVMGLLKSPIVFVAMICLFTVLLLVNKKTFIVPSSISLKIKGVVGLSIFALLFGMIAIAGATYIDFCANKLIFAGQVHHDSLFHISIAAMIRDYGIASIGLHGTPPVFYHTFSHFIFGCISSITGLSLMNVYGNVHSIVIVPLLFLAIVACAEDFIFSNNRKELFIRIGFVGLALVAFGGFDPKAIFYGYGLWDSYLLSESYTISLIFLLAMISCLRIQSYQIRWPLVVLSVVCASLAKISVGVLGGIYLFVNLVLYERERFLYRIFFFIFAACFILLILFPVYSSQMSAYNKQIISQGMQIFSFARKYGSVSGTFQDLQFWISLLRFLTIHFIYTWLLLGLALVSGWFGKNKSPIGNLGITLNIIALLYGLIAMWKLNLFSGAEYYFSNISMFVALPFLALILGQNLSIPFKEGILKAKWWGSMLVIALGLSGAIFYTKPYLIDRGLGKLTAEAEMKQIDNGSSNYIRQLLEIQSDPSTKNYLVYIAKAETGFWNVENWQKAIFLIPAISERPAIYGLPDPVLFMDRVNSYGVESYSQNIFDVAAANRIPHNLLAAEARKLGFKGYINVNSKSWTKHSVDN